MSDATAATPAKAGRPKGRAGTTKKGMADAARREAAAALDRSSAAHLTPVDWKVVKTLELSPKELQFRPDLQGRSAPMDEANVLTMAESLRREGQLSPIQVRESPRGNEIVFGNTRALAGLKIASGYELFGTRVLPDPEFKLRVEVVECDDDTAIKRNISENVHRNELSPIDHATNQEKLRSLGMNDVTISTLYGYAHSSTISRLKKLLTLEKDIQKLVHNGTINRAAAYVLAELPPQDQRSCMDKIAESKGKVEVKTANAKGVPYTQEELDTRAAEAKDKQEFFTDAGLSIGADDVKSALREIRAERKKVEDAEAAPKAIEGGEGTGEATPASTKKVSYASDPDGAKTFAQIKADLTLIRNDVDQSDHTHEFCRMFMAYMVGDDSLQTFVSWLGANLKPDDAA